MALNPVAVESHAPKLKPRGVPEYTVSSSVTVWWKSTLSKCEYMPHHRERRSWSCALSSSITILSKVRYFKIFYIFLFYTSECSSICPNTIYAGVGRVVEHWPVVWMTGVGIAVRQVWCEPPCPGKKLCWSAPVSLFRMTGLSRWC